MTLDKCKATVVVPTTGERGSLLPYSIGSIQKQSIEDVEIFIIGDGVSDMTRKTIYELQEQDNRIRFFDHPKHRRRGEVYRHQALQDARGEFVCYLCDRDLMLPDHVEVLSGLLKTCNFAFTTFIRVREDQSVMLDHYTRYFGPAKKAKKKWVRTADISLSNVGHTLKLYQKLPYGWRTTPEGQFTDTYMWKQFLAHPDCNAYSHHKPTILYFKRGHFPGVPVSKRKKELELWSKKIVTEDVISKIKSDAVDELLEDRLRFRLEAMSNPLISIKGYRLDELPSKIFEKIKKCLK
jgi:glycosyltransferase involved in cell wall biosynthesis